MNTHSVRFKISVSFVLTLVLTVLIFCFSLEKNESDTISRINRSQYASLFQQTVNVIENHERLIELHLFSSLNAIEGELRQLGHEPDNAYLAELAKKYKLSGIYIINNKGFVDKSSIYDLLVKKGLLPGFNLFDRSPAERELIGTTEVYRKTPMLWIEDVKDPSKFYWTYVNDLGYILEVTYVFEDLDRIFSEIKNTFDDVLEVSLITPRQKIMASSLSRDEQNRYNSKILPLIEYGVKEEEHGTRTTLLKSFGNNYRNIGGVPGAYFYTLKVDFDSTKLSNASLFDFDSFKRFSFLLPVPLLIMILYIYLLRLTRGIVSLNRKMQLYMKGSQEIDGQQILKDKDEIHQINKVFDSLTAYIENLLSREKKLSKYKAIGQTTEYLAHDIREPFTKLKALLKLIRLSQKETQSQIDQFIPMIHHSAEKVEAMLSDIMDLGAAGLLTKKPGSLRKLIEQCFLNHTGPTWNKDIALSFELKHSRLILCDEQKFVRILTNLVDNAAIATPLGGRISVRSKDLDETVEVEIHNSGSFIEAERIQSIFDPFVKGRVNGSGLGLAIVRDLVESHGGQVSCLSSRDTGTSFVFTVPVAEGDDNHPLSLPANLRDFLRMDVKLPPQEQGLSDQVIADLRRSLKSLSTPLSICIIDDDDIYISTLEKMLDPVKDLITLCCVSSNFSLDRIAPFLSADLLILDLDLNSELSGHEILKYCREEKFGNYICIHTNRISKHYIRKLSQEGADLVTPKPMSVIHLTNICAAAAEHSV